MSSLNKLSKVRISRRKFMRVAAGGAAAGVSASATLLKAPHLEASPRAVPPNDRVGLGIIGVGIQGAILLRTSLSLPGVECVGAAELYTGRLRLAKEIAGDNIFTTGDYRELLARPGLDAVIVATPDHWHAPLVKACCEAGKDVYCEKPMSYTPQHGLEMIAAEKKHERIVQVGSQLRSSVIYQKAREIFASGVLGTVTMVESTLGRNGPFGAWQYPVPPDASTETIDWETWLGDAPKRPFDPLRFARWRLYRDYSNGLAGDLGIHMITGIHTIAGMDQAPSGAKTFGGIFRWKDAREMPDTITTLYEYPQFPIYLRITQNTQTVGVTRFLGSGGLLEVGGEAGGVRFVPQDGQDSSPNWPANGLPSDYRQEFVRNWREKHVARPGTGNPERRGEHFVAPPGYNMLRDHFFHFFESVRTRKPSVEDATFGHNAALACHMSVYSYFNQTTAAWDEQAGEIRSA